MNNAATKAAARSTFLLRSAGGVAVLSLPVGVWWHQARTTRAEIAHEVATRIRIPGQQTVDDFLIEKCRPGDILVFDRRWETCAAGPWAALACLASKFFLCRSTQERSVEKGHFNHIGIIVPGYEHARHDEFDPSNLLLLEATPQGIVARSLKTRLERTQSRSVLLLQLNAPGEQRDFVNMDDDYDEIEDDSQLTSRQMAVRRTRRHVEKELVKFRDSWVALGDKYKFQYLFSTLTIGGALAYGLGFHEYLSGPVSPSAWLVVMALQQAAAAQNTHVRNERWSITTEDFLRSQLANESNPLRLRPGWRFLAPMGLRERHV